jgi:DNA-binding CsgD family transcriptional regulator
VLDLAMRKHERSSTGPAIGFLLLDSAFNPVVLNKTAAEILSYPQQPDAQRNIHRFWIEKVRTALFAPNPAAGSPLVAEYRSGRRRYSCRSFRVDGQAQGYSNFSIAVLLERESSGSFPLTQLAQNYHLTPREQEVLHFLLQGSTSKEIADRMEISVNTVKAFLRLIMIKLGVTTRAGILGKAITSLPDSHSSADRPTDSSSG